MMTKQPYHANKYQQETILGCVCLTSQKEMFLAPAFIISGWEVKRSTG